jgi:hypothetical protein
VEKQDGVLFLQRILSEIRDGNGQAAVDRYSGLRQVDSKVREVRITLESIDGIPMSLINDLLNDQDFEMNSRRVRLEALANYCENALRLIDANRSSTKPRITRVPDISALATSMPSLEDVISRRWLDAQKCVHQHMYLAAIVLMGSILEGLILARVTLSPSIAYQSGVVPKDKNNRPKQYNDWSLSELINVATDVGWIKRDRGKFGHALRESRNIVHPWVEVTTKADLDQYTCETSWSVLKASVRDLIDSMT